MFKDRKPTLPNRYRVVPENGDAPYYVTLERADEPTEVGTALNAATLNRFLTKDFELKDYNGDGVVNAADVSELASMIADGTATTDEDYNADGVLDSLDVEAYERLVHRFGDVKKEVGSLYGRYLLPDGVLIQWGTISITPTAADTPTSGFVTFGFPFVETPLVFANEVTSVPENVAVGVMRSNVEDPKRQIEIVLTRAGTTPTVINWLAVGKGA